MAEGWMAVQKASVSVDPSRELLSAFSALKLTLNRDWTQHAVLFPAVCKNTRLDDVFNDYLVLLVSVVGHITYSNRFAIRSLDLCTHHEAVGTLAGFPQDDIVADTPAPHTAGSHAVRRTALARCINTRRKGDCGVEPIERREGRCGGRRLVPWTR